jgi:hypothetical protein
VGNKNRERHAEAEASGTEGETQQAQPGEATPVSNNTIPLYRMVPKNEPHDRVGYVIPGVAGCLVIHLSMFKDGAVPSSLTLTCNGQPVELAEPKVKVTDATKAAAAALKAQEKLEKAQVKIAAQAAKAEEKRVKAQAAADAAMAKVAAATQATA